MGTLAQSSPKMQGLLVLASLAAASAQVISYGGLGYPGLGLGYGGLVPPYAYGANIIKPVAKDIEVPVTTIKFEAAETGCTNSFGNAVLPYGLPLGYHGLGYGYGLGLPYAAALPAPTVTEVEVPQYKFVPQEKVVELAPLCQNAWGFGVPCA